ncbi:MAG: TRAP transporter substrate-binding protein [Alphaproteobacteria bacterium]|nr:TRAP transporter substrate-binding protein [Alphaproteobacteria bacterium]
MKTIFAGAAALSFAVGVFAGAANAETIKLETYAGPKHAMNTTAWPTWIKEVTAASGGKLQVKMTYPPINPRDLYDRVRNGITDMAWITHGYTTGRFVLTDMVELPGSNGNGEQMSRAYWRTYSKHFMKKGEHKGVVVLAMFSHGPGMLHTSTPITSIADIKGLKVRTGGGTQSRIAQRLGLVTVSAPVTKAHEILSRGVAKGILFSIETIWSFRLGKAVKYHYSYPGNLYASSFAVIMNKGFYDRLGKAKQAMLWKVSGEHLSGLIGATWDKADQVAIKGLGAAGNTIAGFDAKTTTEIRTRLADLDAEWIGRAQKMGVSNAGAVLKEFRAEVAKIKAGN